MIALLAALGACVLTLVVTEAYGWLPWLSERLIRRATRVLPHQHRERYEEEWLAELDLLPTRGIASLLFAVRILVRARSTRRALEPGYGSAPLKRAIDVTMSSVALLAIAPLLSFLVLAVSIESPGPALFRAERIGRHGRRFKLFRFRTFFLGQGREPRLTRTGGLLRRFGLHQIPEIVNVLRGEMALVGPRALPPGYPVPEHLVEFAGRLKPGMVCWTSLVSGGRLSLEEAQRRDVAHFTNWTLLAELRLLLATVPAVLFPAERR
jgi:lipopolysaccharide/colanic/teichoic acid biosynthesis glycosyltransferase